MSFKEEELFTKDFLSQVTSVTTDSREAKEGSLLFLMPSSFQDKENYFKNAQAQGASLVVHNFTDLKGGLFVKDIHQVFTKFLQTFYKESFENLKIYGITGTNGKTTTAFMLQDMLESYGVSSGIFGTVKNSFKDSELKTNLTSPRAEDFYAFNHQNYHKGMRAVVCEVSSHALDQKRLGLNFLSGAAFTSFSQDHLDYHGSMEAYLDAKRKIVKEALLPSASLFASEAVKEKLSCLERVFFINQSDYTLKILSSGEEGLRLALGRKEKKLEGLLPLYGAYNAENFALAFALLCEHFGPSFFPDQRIFKSFKQIPGRMEKIDLGNESEAFIDFSHTPDSLLKALKTLKSDKKLVVVFGCGGERDQKKRPLMGQIAKENADYVIVTSDNPRSEDQMKIINDIVQGREGFEIEPDRELAILKALEKTSQGKTRVLIAGKGHEAYQEVKGVKRPFSDLLKVKRWKAKK